MSLESVPALLLSALVGFTFLAGASYAGTLWALQTYYDDGRDSIFLR